MTGTHESLLRIAYDHVRRAVVEGELEPGARVTVRPLAEKLGMSPTPIKAALAMLEREGFLVSSRHRGYFVPEVDTADLLELYELREAVDGMAARRAAAAADHGRLADRLAQVLDEQRRVVADGDLGTYGELDVQFHHLIWVGSGNVRLLAVAENLVSQVRLGNRLSAQAPGRLPTALDEHEAILNAIGRGDSGSAERLLRKHVRQSGAALRRYLRHRQP